MKKFLGWILAFFLVLSYVPCMAEESYDNFIIEETETNVIIKGCKNSDITYLYVPGEINGKKVILEREAFGNYKFENLEEVTIGEGIEVLPYGLFPIANKIKKINLPDSLKEIGISCFYGAWALEEIDLKNVEKIGESAFQSCDELKKVTHNGKLRHIDVWAFSDCPKLSVIDLRSVKHLGREAFSNCSSLTEVSLESLETWDGIRDSQVDDSGKYYLKQAPITHGGVDLYYGIKAYNMGPPFTNCTSLEKVAVTYPYNKTGESFPSLILNCNNVKSFTIKNYQNTLASYELAWLSFDNSDGSIYVNKRGGGVTVYSTEEEAEEYAKKLGLDFVLTEDKRIEVTPIVQGIHGGIILKGKYFTERVTKMAESLGGKVIVSGDNIVVQKDGKSLLITGETVYYKENGQLVTESLYYDYTYMKIPERALESVFGTDKRKSEEYKEFFRTYNNKIYHIAGTIETPYGSVVETYTGGVMHSVANILAFVRWDGESIDLTYDAPYYNYWCHGRWKKIELSEDGKILTITYPENKKRTTFKFSDISPERVLWDEGTYVITANLETGDVKCVIEPLE